jgi:hypothetical protein
MMNEAGRRERSGLEPSKGGAISLVTSCTPDGRPKKPVKEFGAGFRIDLLSYSLITDAMVEDANMRERFTKLFAKAIRARGSFGSDADREYFGRNWRSTGSTPA